MDEMTIQITFSSEELEYHRTKFDIENKEDLYAAVMECVSTYMEM